MHSAGSKLGDQPKNLDREIETSPHRPRPPPRPSDQPKNLDREIETLAHVLNGSATVVSDQPKNLDREIETKIIIALVAAASDSDQPKNLDREIETPQKYPHPTTGDEVTNPKISTAEGKTEKKRLRRDYEMVTPPRNRITSGSKGSNATR